MLPLCQQMFSEDMVSFKLKMEDIPEGFVKFSILKRKLWIGSDLVSIGMIII